MERWTEPGLCSCVQTLVQFKYFYYNKLLTYRAPNTRIEIIRNNNTESFLLTLRNTNNARIDGQRNDEDNTLSA